MIVEQAEVVAADGEHAWVEARSRTACSACEQGVGCGGGVLAKLFAPRTVRVRALNGAGARPGDAVLLGIDERALLLASAAVYFVPLLGLILGAAAAKWLALTVAGGGGEVAALAGALAGLIGSLSWARANAVGAAARGRLQPVVLRRIGSISI